MPVKRKQKSRGGAARRNNPRAQALLSDGPSYQGQQKSVLTLQGTPYILATTVTTGLIASAVGIDVSHVTDFGTRFNSTFDEYRILSCVVNVVPIGTAAGVSKFWFDEKSTSTPTLAGSQERITLTIPNTNASRSKQTMRWRARDILDLEYTATGTAVTPVTFKVYSDAANYGAPVTVGNVWLVETYLTFEFRGIKSA